MRPVMSRQRRLWTRRPRATEAIRPTSRPPAQRCILTAFRPGRPRRTDSAQGRPRKARPEANRRSTPRDRARTRPRWQQRETDGSCPNRIPRPAGSKTGGLIGTSSSSGTAKRRPPTCWSINSGGRQNRWCQHWARARRTELDSDSGGMAAVEPARTATGELQSPSAAQGGAPALFPCTPTGTDMAKCRLAVATHSPRARPRSSAITQTPWSQIAGSPSQSDPEPVPKTAAGTQGASLNLADACRKFPAGGGEHSYPLLSLYPGAASCDRAAVISDAAL